MRWGWLVVLVGCGRLGFDSQRSQVGAFDAPPDVTVDATCGAVEMRTISCGPGFAGTIDQTRTFTCPPGAWSGWTEVNSTCVASVYVWVPQSAATGPFASPLTAHANESCLPQGAMMPCSDTAPAGTGYYHYDACLCE